MTSRTVVRILLAGLAVVIGLGMAVSYVALQATTVRVGDGRTAWLYPLAVDGLVVLAVAASLVLRGARGHGWALGTVIGYTAASAALNVWHAAGSDHLTATSQVWEWGRVVVAAVLPVATTALGTHLVVVAVRHLADTAEGAPAVREEDLDPVPGAAADGRWDEQADVVPDEAVEAGPSGAPVEEADGWGDARPGRVPRSRPKRRAKRKRRTGAELLAAARALAEQDPGGFTAVAVQRRLKVRAERARALRDEVLAERVNLESGAPQQDAVAVSVGGES